MDFAWWDPFDDDILAIMQDNVVESTGVKPIKRGGQFRHYTGHDLSGIGSRLPSGGRKGNTLTVYAGLEGGTDKGIKILFRQAQVRIFSIAYTLYLLSISDIRNYASCCKACSPRTGEAS